MTAGHSDVCMDRKHLDLGVVGVLGRYSIAHHADYCDKFGECGDGADTTSTPTQIDSISALPIFDFCFLLFFPRYPACFS